MKLCIVRSTGLILCTGLGAIIGACRAWKALDLIGRRKHVSIEVPSAQCPYSKVPGHIPTVLNEEILRDDFALVNFRAGCFFIVY